MKDAASNDISIDESFIKIESVERSADGGQKIKNRSIDEVRKGIKLKEEMESTSSNGISFKKWDLWP